MKCKTIFKLVSFYLLLLAMVGCKNDKKEGGTSTTPSETTTPPQPSQPAVNRVFEGGTWVIDPNQTTLPKGTYLTPSQADSVIGNYWGTRVNSKAYERKYFLVTTDELNSLFAKASTGDSSKAVFKVSKIDDPNAVSGEWMPYDKNAIEKIRADTANTDNYYIIDRKFIFNKNSGDTPDGIARLKQGESVFVVETKLVTSNAICARLAEHNGKKIIFSSTFVHFMRKSSISGEPPGSGMEIPPGL